MHTCYRCTNTFKNKHSLIQHLNRKYPCSDKTLTQHQYLYVIHTREYINLNQPVYKVGRTNQPLSTDGITKRMEQYPKESIQKAMFHVENSVKAEFHTLAQLNLCKDLKQRDDIGFEYFEGPIKTILSIILDTVDSFTNPIVPEQNELVVETDKAQINANPKAENTQNTERNAANEDIKAANAEINKIKINQCKYCSKICTKKSHLQQHMNSCKEKDDHVRCLERQLNIVYNKPITTNTCRFCNATLTQKSALTRHDKTCKVKQKYRENLEAQLQEKIKQHVAKQSCFERLFQK